MWQGNFTLWDDAELRKIRKEDPYRFAHSGDQGIMIYPKSAQNRTI